MKTHKSFWERKYAKLYQVIFNFIQDPQHKASVSVLHSILLIAKVIGESEEGNFNGDSIILRLRNAFAKEYSEQITKKEVK